MQIIASLKKGIDRFKKLWYNKDTIKKGVVYMATSRKTLREELKASYLGKISEMFKASEDVLRTGSNEIAFPVVDREGNEDFILITVRIPTGSHDGEPYDGYSMAQEYQMKLEEKEAKEKERLRKKEEKIKRDTASRQAKKEAREKRERERKERIEKGE